MKQTLCWTCRRATNKPGLGCSWSRQDGIPVKGWNARPTTINCRDNSGWDGGSYHVKECPLYLADGKKDETGCRVYQNLAAKTPAFRHGGYSGSKRILNFDK